MHIQFNVRKAVNLLATIFAQQLSTLLTLAKPGLVKFDTEIDCLIRT